MNTTRLAELILEDPSMHEMLTVQARKDLLLHYLNNRPAQTYGTKKEEASDLYMIAQKFGVKQTDKILSEHLNVSRTAFKRRIDSARSGGLIQKKRGSI